MKHRGFSRLEAILVLSVAALLAAALFPIVAHRRTVQRQEVCQSNLKYIALCMQQYVQDNDEEYPPRVPCQVSSPPAFQVSSYMAFGWADVLDPYVDMGKQRSPPFVCPTESHFNVDSPLKPGYTDYWFNRNLAGAYESSLYPYLSQTLLLGDGDGGSPQSNARYAINALPKSWSSTPGSPARRHFDGANYAFADGHVKWLKPQQITNAKPDKKHPVSTFALGSFALH